MTSSDRYLHFDNIDMNEPVISSRCSRCASEFASDPKPGESVNNVLSRIRAEFNAHECQPQSSRRSKSQREELSS